MDAKNITTDKLASMVQKGFAATDKKVEDGFKEVNKKLDRIENELIKEHSEELKNLKARVRILENALGIE